MCTRNYGLDPADYVNSPQLIWDAMLRNTHCTLDLISEPEIFSMVDARIRGGVPMISTRFAEPNNSYMATSDPAHPTCTSSTSSGTTSKGGQ